MTTNCMCEHESFLLALLYAPITSIGWKKYTLLSMSFIAPLKTDGPHQERTMEL